MLFFKSRKGVKITYKGRKETDWEVMGWNWIMWR